MLECPSHDKKIGHFLYWWINHENHLEHGKHTKKYNTY